MQKEKLWGQSRIAILHELVLFAYSCISWTVYKTVLRFKKVHQQGKLGVSKSVQFKSKSNVKYPSVRVPAMKDILAVRVLAVKDILAVSASSEGYTGRGCWLQFDMITPKTVKRRRAASQ